MPNSILIVDDQPAVRRALRLSLENAGFCVCAEAVDGLQAIEQAARFLPDLIILDLRMPKMSGIEAGSALRNRFPATPIVLLTMYGAIPAMAAAVGITAVVDKSEGAGNLVDCVRKLLAGLPQDATPASESADCSNAATSQGGDS